MFSMLEPSAGTRRRRAASLLCGVLLQVLALTLAVMVSLLFPQELAVTRHIVFAWLPPVERPKPPEVRHLPKPTHVVIPPVAKTPHAIVLPPPPVVEPKVQKTPPPVTAMAIPVPPPPVPTSPVTQPAPTPKPKEQLVVRTGVFGGTQEKPTTKLPPSRVQTGGFGDPQGFKGQAKGDSLGNVPKLGSFDLPDGSGYGNGTGGKRGVPGIVASAGFGSAVAGPGGNGSGGGGAVAVGGFEKSHQVAPAQTGKPADPSPADFEPVEILFKPTPVYTDEARRLGIQGDVVLSVVFLASGSLKLNGVVRSLGHGLDQAAEQAAKQIRFKPAQRAGQPSDFPATLHIEFRLAGQST